MKSKATEQQRWAVLIGIPLWLLIALPMFSAMVKAYGRDSPMLILGAGAIAQTYCQAFQRLTRSEIVGVADVRAEAAEALAAPFAGRRSGCQSGGGLCLLLPRRIYRPCPRLPARGRGRRRPPPDRGPRARPLRARGLHAQARRARDAARDAAGAAGGFSLRPCRRGPAAATNAAT